ncbi:hypothetical protein BJ165DRAFT_1529631 [Panaeolus papilionaceus]|nr:hypothetical protein BJ165DRAFT_1529631 [Panaeolus papilionaceus]
MPPSLRKRKQATKPVETKPKRVKTMTVVEHNHKINTTGLAALPDELHLEIFSHLPSVLICCEEENLPLDRPGTDRHFTLNSLSQTCRSLRAVYLAYLWERIEVYDSFKLPGKGTSLPKIPTAKKKKQYTSSIGAGSQRKSKPSVCRGASSPTGNCDDTTTKSGSYKENRSPDATPVPSFENLGVIRIRADIILFPYRGSEEEVDSEEQDKWLKWAERTLHKVQSNGADKQSSRIYFTTPDGHCTEHLVQPDTGRHQR